MDVKFKVHNVFTTKVDRSIEIEGAQVVASVDAVMVELTGAEDGVGSLTLQFLGAKAREVLGDPNATPPVPAKFERDAEVVWSI